MTDKKEILPLIEALEKVYGKPSGTGFGSAVFYKSTKNDGALESIAAYDYKTFMGDQWNAESEARWKSVWKLVYERSTGTTPDILAELNDLKDADAKRSVPLLTEFVEHADQGKLALAAVFNHTDIVKFQVFNVGDGEALAGLILCGLFSDLSVCSVICLMD
jgi:hypothetical protein